MTSINQLLEPMPVFNNHNSKLAEEVGVASTRLAVAPSRLGRAGCARSIEFRYCSETLQFGSGFVLMLAGLAAGTQTNRL
jgi:hypothetical protein